MSSFSDKETVVSYRLLRRVITERTKPIVFWLGAGVSAWNGYPDWRDLARKLRKAFFDLTADFDNELALTLLDRDLPAFFQMCKDLNSALYFRSLTDSLSPRPLSPLYQRFVSKLAEIQPSHIITTNVDEMLEESLGQIRVLENTDISLCPELLHSDTSFIAKLHGSISSVASMVFTTKDYDVMRSDSQYLAAVKSVLISSAVVFLGYSVRDEYIFKLLQQTAGEQELFGTGPHFIVTANTSRAIPHIHRILYRTDRYGDHRGAVRVFDVMQQSICVETATRSLNAVRKADTKTIDASRNQKTAYYISDFKPPGTWNTAESATYTGSDGTVGKFTSGLGFSNDELPTSESTAMHDFTVGLICFDRIYLQLVSLPSLFSIVKEDLFREIIEADVLRFIHTVQIPAVIHQPDETFGVLSLLLLGGSSARSADLQPGETIPEISVREMLDRQISPAKGKEREGLEFIEKIEKTVHRFRYADHDAIRFEITDALLMPHITRLLGISDAIPPTKVPLWLMFPYLRMAHLVHTGGICSKLGIQAAKVPFGGTQLISAAFGIQLASEWAERVASYGLSGRFDTNLGAYVLQQPQIIRKILKFRNSSEGERFRREVEQALLREEGAEFNASVDAGLKRNISSDILQKGRNKFLSLMTEHANITPIPAVWADRQLSDDSTVSWRRKSHRMLLQLCKTRGISKNDPCLCGSGDKLRLCCLRPLAS